MEVLVACGILVIALGSIAAVLPAAGARLAEAAAHDRAAAVAAAAMAEIQARNLVSRQLIPSGTWLPAPAFAYSPSAVVFGETLSLALTASATSSGTSSGFVTGTGELALTATSGTVALTPSGTITIGGTIGSSIGGALISGTGGSRVAVLSAPVTSALSSLISTDISNADRRGFFLDDEVRYLPSTLSALPANWFVSGVRQFNRGVCWGAMVAPVGAPWATTTAAKVSVAVFRKPGNATALTLRSGTSGQSAATGIFVTSSTLAPVSLQRSLLKPCSMVLAINGTATPQWLPIRSSWILTGTMTAQGGNIVGISGTNTAALVSSGTARTCVTFTSPVPQTLYSGTPATLNVIGFENLLLVDEKIFPLP